MRRTDDKGAVPRILNSDQHHHSPSQALFVAIGIDGVLFVGKIRPNIVAEYNIFIFYRCHEIMYTSAEEISWDERRGLCEV